MADKDINIKITTAADTAGADAAAEALKKVADAQAAATTPTSSGGSSGVNPFTDGSQLRAGKKPEAEAIAETTVAIEEQVEALEDLTDAEAGVIDATKRLNQTADEPGGFKSLFDQQRLQAVGREIGELGRTVGDLVREFAGTEAGQKALAGLSDETKLFGGIALETGTAVAQGWAQGGPIGAALAGLNVLVKEVGDSFLAVARAEEKAAADLTSEMDRLTRQTRDRQSVAADRSVEDAFRREGEWLGDQNEKLAEANELLAARRDLNRAERALRDEQDLAGGASEEEIRVRKIRDDAKAETEEIKSREKAARDAALAQELEVDRQAKRAAGIGKLKGTDSEEFRDANDELEKATGELSDRQRQAGVASQKSQLELRELEQRTAQRLTAEARRSSQDAARDTARRADDAQREQEREEARALAEGRTTATRREGLGRQGEGLADTAARAVAGRSERAARQLEQLGDNLAGNPTAAAADMLGKTVDKFAASLQGRDAATARKLRELSQKFEKIEADLKKLKTP